ncbi:MAG: ribosomal-protein-alanine N-acetyltransferase [Rhodospirillaceae bacterium]|nr:MAG: ribosomal-protein-alanine N-acetyltransferase [Rhodospirillaceae bacterium]
MNIVEAGLSYANVLAELHKEGFDTPWSAAAFESSLASPGIFALIAQDKKDQPSGFVLIRAVGDEAEILTILTRPAARRSGIARALMSKACAEAIERHAQKMFLEVAIDNPNACGLYLSLGFKEVGHRKGYYERPQGPRVDAVIMALDLAP